MASVPHVFRPRRTEKKRDGKADAPGPRTAVADELPAAALRTVLATSAASPRRAWSRRGGRVSPALGRTPRTRRSHARR